MDNLEKTKGVWKCPICDDLVLYNCTTRELDIYRKGHEKRCNREKVSRSKTWILS